MKSVKKYYGLFYGLSRLGVGAVLPALLAFTAACVLSVSSAQAGVTEWDFTGSTYSGQGPYTPPTSGSDFIPVSTSLAVSGNGHAANTGFLITSYSSTGSSTLTFTLNSSSTVSLTGLTYSYNYANSGSVSPTIVWTLGSFTSSGTENNINNGTSSGSIDLTAAGSSNNSGTTFTLTGTQTGVTGVNGNIDFYNFSITAVPEPVNYALAGFGLIFVGGSAGRFYLARRRVTTAG